MAETSLKNVPVLMFALGAELIIKFTVALKMGNVELGTGNHEKLNSFFFLSTAILYLYL